jgi:hypothetical protein
MSLKLTPMMVENLRAAYGAVDRVDTTGAHYRNLVKLLDSLSQTDLRILRDARIKWISSLASQRVQL